MKLRSDNFNCSDCNSRSASVFCDLHSGEMDLLSSEKGCATYKKGQTIFNAGAYPHGLYCVKEGKIKIFRIGDEGKEQIVRLAKAGDILGYRALLSGDKYSSGAEVIEESKICFIPQKTFLSLIEGNGMLSMKLMKLLSADLKNAEHRMIDLAQKPVRERVAEALLYLRSTYGVDEDGMTINVSLSREEIANIVGTATETTIRLLSEFKNDEVIALKGKRISILNSEQLIRAANVYD